MDNTTILDWTNTRVRLQFDELRDVKYQVYRDGKNVFLEVRGVDDEPIHTLQLPDGMKLDRTSYEV